MSLRMLRPLPGHALALVLGLAAACAAAPAWAEVSLEDALAGLPPACGASAPISRGWISEPGLSPLERVRAPLRAIRRSAPAAPPAEEARPEPVAQMQPALHRCTLSPVAARRVRL